MTDWEVVEMTEKHELKQRRDAVLIEASQNVRAQMMGRSEMLYNEIGDLNKKMNELEKWEEFVDKNRGNEGLCDLFEKHINKAKKF